MCFSSNVKWSPNIDDYLSLSYEEIQCIQKALIFSFKDFGPKVFHQVQISLHYQT
jgi:hypothetical protein